MHSKLGPGLLERTYCVCLCHELQCLRLTFETEKLLPIEYDGLAIDLIGVLLVCLLVVTAGVTAQQALLDVAMVVALISFVGTVAYARYIEREGS